MKQELRHVNFKLPTELVDKIETVRQQHDCESLTAAAVLVMKRGLEAMGIVMSNPPDAEASG